MAEFTVGTVRQDVRLRNWDAGRKNVLSLAVQQLEQQLNQALASGAQQTKRRKISSQVPQILDLAVAPGFRQAQVTFSVPPGLNGHPRRQLLFYEIQHAADAGFANATTINTPQRHVAIAGLGLGTSRAFRARVVNTFGEAGLWSSTVTVTVAQSKIQQTTISDISVRLEKPIGQWQIISETIYQPVEAKACINAQIAAVGPHFDTTKKFSGSTSKILYGGPAHVQFRWRIGSFNDFTNEFELKETGQRAMLSTRPGFSDAADKSSVRNPLAIGTIITDFFKLTAGVNAKVQLQASLVPGSEWLGPERERAFQKTDPVVFLRNGQVIEVLEDL